MFPFRNVHTILVVDDEVGPRQAIQMILQDKYNVLTCDNAQEAINIVSSGEVDVVMLDIRMPKVNGLELLKAIKSASLDVEVVLITGYPSMQGAITAMQYGAYDYVIKPFDKERILQVVRRGVVRQTQKKLKKNFTSYLISEIFEKFSLQKE